MLFRYKVNQFLRSLIVGLSASFYDKRNRFDLLKGQNHKTAKLKGEETSGESIPVILSFLSIFDLFPPLTLEKNSDVCKPL